MSYAIISLGGKQYRVSEGERLLVDRLPQDEGASLTLSTLLVGGDGDTRLAPDDVTVSARVVRHVLGEKIRIGKYKPKKGYRRHTGFRSRLSQIEIESIGAAKRRSSAAAEPAKEERPAQRTERKAHPPKGYDDLTVVQIKEQVGAWRRPQLEAALEHEREHQGRKGAIEALEAAIAAKETA